TGASPVLLSSGRALERRAWLRGALASSQRSIDGADRLRKELGVARPCSDPALRAVSRCSDCIKQARSRGMARFALGPGRRSLSPSLGVLIVAEKSGVQANAHDVGRLSRFVSADCRLCHCCAGDIQNASYAVDAPDEQGDAFRLAAELAGAAGGPASERCPARPGDLLIQRLSVRPMGWGRALRFCQLAIEGGARCGCLPPERLVRQRCCSAVEPP
ncbi:unnamed protein product, partial [Prorocentrum cordatum]